MPENIKEKIASENENPTVETSLRKEGLLDLDKETTIPREVDSWMEKHEKNNQVTTKLGEDGNAKTASDMPKVVINAPVTRNTFLEWLKMPANEAKRWWSTFLEKMIKMDKEVKFKED